MLPRRQFQQNWDQTGDTRILSTRSFLDLEPCNSYDLRQDPMNPFLIWGCRKPKMLRTSKPPPPHKREMMPQRPNPLAVSPRGSKSSIIPTSHLPKDPFGPRSTEACRRPKRATQQRRLRRTAPYGASLGVKRGERSRGPLSPSGPRKETMMILSAPKRGPRSPRGESNQILSTLNVKTR